MVNPGSETKLYGLIGKPLSHSFSAEYFARKFRAENIRDCRYHLFELEGLSDLDDLIRNHQNLQGLNVTIPYKRPVIKYLDKISPEAMEIGAVNCIKINRNEKKVTLKGYNTDIYGFEKSINPLLKPHHHKSLVLGTGGSAKAVAWVLNKYGIETLFVSRTPHDCNQVRYSILNEDILSTHLLIVNTTPVGMYPNEGQFPDIPFEFIGKNHLLFDLVYNPAETWFLRKGKQQGASIKNGLEMLQLQAEKSWEIWNDYKF
ncbi:MAG: shikimate dehydrogenase [Bacteroidales bacterium]|nr:shikimate dehydrogenase [Bacteroidales bacterium]